jgi:peptidoglycan/LPS O-acetylase OafA/YrhL
MPHQLTRLPARPAADRRTYLFIDAIRGVASLVILAHHLLTYVPRVDETLAAVPVLHHVVWWYGGLATQVFLVISGFVGGVSLARATPEAADLGRLMLVRYLRLALPAVVTLLFALGLYAIMPSSWAAFPLFDEVTAPGVLAHAVFLQDVLGYPSLLAGFWYLSIDWQCNAVMCVLIIVQDAILRRLPGLSRSAPSRSALSHVTQGLAVVGLPMLVALLSLFLWNGAVTHETYATYFFGIVFLGTLAGLAVAGRISPAFFWAYVAAVAVAVVVQSRPHPAVALVAGVSIYLLARWQPSAPSHDDPLLGWLGRISYALFLVHYPTIWAVTSVARGVGGDAAAASWPSLLAAVAASLVAAVLLHRLVEVPTLALVGRLKPRQSGVVLLSR